MSAVIDLCDGDFFELLVDGKHLAVIAPAEVDGTRWQSYNDAQHGEEYVLTYSAPAIGDDGRDYIVRWSFDQVRGAEDAPDDLDFDGAPVSAELD